MEKEGNNVTYKEKYELLSGKLKKLFQHFVALYADADEKNLGLYKDAYGHILNELSDKFNDVLNIKGTGVVDRGKHKVVINTCHGTFGLSDVAWKWLIDNCGTIKNKFTRHDPILVECVETLGDKANDRFSRLSVVEIECNLYRIEEYDGKERVVTPKDDQNWIVIDDSDGERS